MPYKEEAYQQIRYKYSRIRDRLKTKASKSKNQNDWSKYKRTRNKVNNLKKHAKELFYNNLENILLENSSNNKRDYWRVIRHFVKNNNSKSCIPPMCSPVDNKYSYTDRDIAETLNSFLLLLSQKLMMRMQSYLILSRKLVVFCTQSTLRLIKLKH